MERIREKMLAARRLRERLQVQGGITGAARTVTSRMAGRLSRLSGGTGKRQLLATGLVLGVLLAGLVWQFQPGGHQAGGRTAGHHSFDSMSDTFATVREMRDTLSRLALQVEQLTTSVAGLEEKVEHIQLASAPGADTAGTLTRLPPPAAGATQARAAGGKPEPAATGAAIAGSSAPPGDAAPQHAGRTPDGHWVINLASFPDQAAVDRFTSEAAARGIETDTRQVTIEGRDYWRVQVTGFPSSADAIAGSAGIKETLGLKEVWVARQ